MFRRQNSFESMSEMVIQQTGSNSDLAKYQNPLYTQNPRAKYQNTEIVNFKNYIIKFGITKQEYGFLL